MNPELKYEEKLSRRGFFRITAQIALGFVGLSAISFVCGGEEALTQMKGETMSVIMLPKPMLRGKISLEEAINKRRSERAFRDRAVSKSLRLPEKHRPLYVMPVGYVTQ